MFFRLVIDPGSFFVQHIPMCCFSSGSGTSKKLAKRNAAAKMLSRIHDVPVDLRTSNDADTEDDTFTMVRKTDKTCNRASVYKDAACKIIPHITGKVAQHCMWLTSCKYCVCIVASSCPSSSVVYLSCYAECHLPPYYPLSCSYILLADNDGVYSMNLISAAHTAHGEQSRVREK